MDEIIDKLSKAIICEMNVTNPNWFNAIYTIQATPSVNVSYQMGLEVFNQEKQPIDNAMIWINDCGEYKNLFF